MSEDFHFPSPFFVNTNPIELAAHRHAVPRLIRAELHNVRVSMGADDADDAHKPGWLVQRPTSGYQPHRDTQLPAWAWVGPRFDGLDPRNEEPTPRLLDVEPW